MHSSLRSSQRPSTMQHRGPVAVVPAGGGHHAPRPSGPINHAPRPNGPTKTTSNITTTITKTNTTPSSSPNMDSTLSLVKQLVTHFVEASFGQCRVRNRDQEEAFKGRLKVLVYSILLSHRKGKALYFLSRSRILKRFGLVLLLFLKAIKLRQVLVSVFFPFMAQKAYNLPPGS